MRPNQAISNGQVVIDKDLDPHLLAEAMEDEVKGILWDMRPDYGIEIVFFEHSVGMAEESVILAFSKFVLASFEGT